MEMRKMNVLNKQKDEIYVLFHPDERLKIGDVLDIGGIVSQVIDVEYANLPGIVEHMLRKSIMGHSQVEQIVDPKIESYLHTLTDHKLAITKIRGTVKSGIYEPGFTELSASRSTSQVRLLEPEELLDITAVDSKYPADFARLVSSEGLDYSLPLDKFGINLVTGMKGSGKSYAAKRLLLRLIENGKVVVVLDLNGEYINLWKDEDGNPNDYYNHIQVLNPKAKASSPDTYRLRIPLSEIGYDDLASFVNISTDTQMYNELIRFWHEKKGETFDLNDLEDWTQNNVKNEATRTGLLGKIGAAKALNLFGPFDMKSMIVKLEKKGGGAQIINLRRSNRKEREVIVRVVVGNISRYRHRGEVRPLVLFAEEAQLYVETEMWDNLLTRMRHYGIFPTFITNDPRTLPDEVFSLCDNLMAFRFHNRDDLRQISKAKVIDEATVDMLRQVRNTQCILIGDMTGDFPLLLEIKPEEGVMMGGETQQLF
jgi:hypothetical protein